MPYISSEERQTLRVPKTSGQLNYSITQLINSYIKVNKMSYQTFNDILGALEGAKMEFYRRIVTPYEDKKRSENGDVYIV